MNTHKHATAGVADSVGTGAQRVLVLHGWALDSSVWRWARDGLDTQTFSYAFLDFPGYGVVAQQAPAQGMDGMARAALNAADALGWDRFALLGHSMGGGAALRAATLAPERIAAVAALTPVSPGGTPLDAASYEHFKSLWPDADSLLQSVGPFLPEARRLAMGDATRTTLSRSVWEAYLANWTRASFSADLDRIVAPTELIVGEADPIVSAEYLAPTLAALRDGRLTRLPGAGHYPMVETTDAAIAAWERALRLATN